MTDQLGDVLARIGQELAKIAQENAALEAIIQDTLATSKTPVDLANWRALQGMDLMTQKIGDLGRFLQHIAADQANFPIEMRDAVSVLHLQEIADALLGNPTGKPRDGGAVELFL
jgi:hypothetical protein